MNISQCECVFIVTAPLLWWLLERHIGWLLQQLNIWMKIRYYKNNLEGPDLLGSNADRILHSHLFSINMHHRISCWCCRYYDEVCGGCNILPWHQQTAHVCWHCFWSVCQSCHSLLQRYSLKTYCLSWTGGSQNFTDIVDGCELSF